MKKHSYIALFAVLLILAPLGLLSQEKTAKTEPPQDKPAQAKPARTKPLPIEEEKPSDYWSRFKFEISTAVSYQRSVLDTSYFHQYSPPFLSGPYESVADHTINIKGKDGWGFNIGAAYYPLHFLGVQFLVDYARPKLSGGNTQYNVLLNYALSSDATPPYPNIFEYTYGWPPTAGDITEICLSLNGVFRLPVSDRLAFHLSGGLTYFHVKGEGTGLAYSYYWWEDGWFKGRTFNVKTEIGTIDKLGLNVGAEFNYVLWSNMCFTLDARYFAGSSSTLPMKIIDEGLVTPPPPPFRQITFDEVRETMNLQQITVNPSFYRINIGLKYLF
jgi:hypothetical protein